MDSEFRPREIVGTLIEQAHRLASSDIHIQITEGKAEVFFRVDGVLQKVKVFENQNADRIGNRIIYMAGLKTYQSDLPQEGRITGEEAGIEGDIRVSCYPTVDGLRIALRLLDDNGELISLDKLALPETVISDITRFLGKPDGTLLLTGPSGSGKTTTIYSCLKQLQGNGNRHIVTIEDPVECRIAGIMQTQVRREQGLDFPEALRRLLRQDPEIIVIGEIRDPETAKIAFQAALTGHKVISTVHAGSSGEVIMRLLEIGLEPAVIASSLDLIVAQRLLRKVCGSCGGEGCDSCAQTGYRGRIPAAESLMADEDVRALIRNNPDEKGIRSFLESRGFRTIADSADSLREQGITDAAELKRVIGTES